MLRVEPMINTSFHLTSFILSNARTVNQLLEVGRYTGIFSCTYRFLLCGTRAANRPLGAYTLPEHCTDFRVKKVGTETNVCSLYGSILCTARKQISALQTDFFPPEKLHEIRHRLFGAEIERQYIFKCFRFFAFVIIFVLSSFVRRYIPRDAVVAVDALDRFRRVIEMSLATDGGCIGQANVDHRWFVSIAICVLLGAIRD